MIDVGDQLLSIDGLDVSGKKPAEISHLIVGERREGDQPPVCFPVSSTQKRLTVPMHI